jgi:hypothetical protein
LDLDRYLGLPSPTAIVGLEAAPRATALPRVLRRPLLVGSLTFAVVWFAIVKLHLLDGATTTVAFGLALFSVAVLGAIVWRSWLRDKRAGSALVEAAAERLRAADIEGAIERCKRCLASDPTIVERADAERMLATCAAFEMNFDEALLLAEMAEATLGSEAPGLHRAAHRAVAARAAAVRAFIRALRGEGDVPAPAESDDREAMLAAGRARLLSAALRDADDDLQRAAAALNESLGDVATPFDRLLAEGLAKRAHARKTGAYRAPAQADEGAEAAERFVGSVTRTLDARKS